MTTNERSTVSAALFDACRAMVRSNGRPWETTNRVRAFSELAGRLVVWIGIGGADRIRGNLVLSAQPDVLRRLYPPTISATDLSTECLADWASEMANQILGRVKNRLGEHGLDLSQGIPAVVTGDQLRLCHGRNAIGYSMRSGQDEMDIVLEIEREGERNLFCDSDQRVAALPEGSVLLF